MNRQEEYEGLDEDQRRRRRVRRDEGIYFYAVSVGAGSAQVSSLGPKGWGLERQSWEVIRRLGYRYMAGAFMAWRLSYEEQRRRLKEGVALSPVGRSTYIEGGEFFFPDSFDEPMTTPRAMEGARAAREHFIDIGEWPYWWDGEELEERVEGWREDANRLTRAGVNLEEARRLGADENVIGMMREMLSKNEGREA